MSILNSNDHFADESTEAPNLDAGTDTPILTTKLFRPLVTRDLIPRTHLLQRLEHSRERPLTLISAPPGYGKSALASAWVETSGRPHAWVSLDETDNDLRTFVAYLIAALNKAFPHLVWKSQLMVHAPILPPADKVARTLLLDLQQIQTPCFIVLDDLHVITENAIYELLSEYLRHPPQFVHLLLIGRVDPSLPIATMRARGEVTEVRARDLRFSADEAAQLLSQLLAREIDEAVTADWVSRTEGWVAALRLAALSLRHRGAADELQSDFNGDNRYLQEYLLAEVLQGLPSGFRKCLIKISVLDRFCNALCTALCQCDGASRPTELSTPGLVQWMQKNNLFLVPLDDQHQWFRFHHLFQRLLRDQLQATFAEEEIAMLHLCAAEWLEDHRFPGEAFQHALAANDTEAATEIVTRHRYDLMNTDQWHRLGRWLKALPGHVVADNPVLMITLGQIGLFAGQDAEVINTPKEAERLLAIRGADTATRDAVTGEIAVLQAIRDLAYGKPISAIAGAQLGLQLLPQRAQYSRALAIGVNAMSLQCMGDLSRGVEMIRQTLAEPAWPDNIKARLSFYLATVFAMEGHLEQVIASARKCLSISDRLYLPATSSYGRYFVGVSHYLRNEFDEAETQLAALHADRAISAPSYAAAGTIALALIHMARGEMDEAERVIGQMKAYLQNLNDTFAQVLMEAFGVELALSKGDLVKARQLSRGVNFDYRPPVWYFYTPQLVPIKLLIADGSPAEALAHLNALDAKLQPLHRNNVRIDILILQALAYEALGHEKPAFNKISAALALAAAGGHIRNFVDLGEPMAALLGRFQPQEADQSMTLAHARRILSSFMPDNPLTARETEILNLLASDLSPQEIADKLVIATSTFYTHTKRIYKKLGAHSRFEAVQRAKEISLL